MTTKEPAVKEEPAKPWYDDYPIQRNVASAVTREALLSWMEKGKVSGKDFILVDLRRTDFEVSLANHRSTYYGLIECHGYWLEGLTVTGRDHSWINQSTCSVPVLYNSHAVYPLLHCWNNQCDLVLQ
jgi:hypothetical protein